MACQKALGAGGEQHSASGGVDGGAREPEALAANVRLCVETGVAGLSIEDATGDPARPLFELTLAIDRIRADIKYLASDQLQGRGVGSRGEELAIDYIAKQFEAAGTEVRGRK